MSILENRIAAPKPKDGEKRKKPHRMNGAIVASPKRVHVDATSYSVSDLQPMIEPDPESKIRLRMGGYLAPTVALNSMTPAQDFSLSDDPERIVWNMRSDLIITPEMVIPGQIRVNGTLMAGGRIPRIYAANPFADAPYPSKDGVKRFRPFDAIDPSLWQKGDCENPPRVHSSYVFEAHIYVLPHPDIEIMRFTSPTINNQATTWIDITGVTGPSALFGRRIPLRYYNDKLFHADRMVVAAGLGSHIVDGTEYPHQMPFGDPGQVANDSSGSSWMQRDTALIASAAGCAIIRVVVDRDQDGKAVATGWRLR